jgi:hypothetical protein
VTPRKNKGGRPPRTEPAERLISYLPVPLKRQLEHLAVDERESVTALVIDAVRAYLARRRTPTR